MFKQYFDRMPRRLYWTLVNFVKLMVYIVSVTAGLLSLFAIGYYSQQWFGSPIPFFILCLLGGISWVSFSVSKWDVEKEQREQEKVERALKKDW